MNSEDEITKKDEETKKKIREEVCYLCRRPESAAGKLLHLQKNICVCPDCLQKSFDMIDLQGHPMLGGNFDPMMFAMGMPPFLQQNQQKTRQKKVNENSEQEKEAENEKKAGALLSVPAPHKIKERLDEYVVGQEQAKKAIAVAVYNHYKRIRDDRKDGVEIEKSNILMLGPTGSGKTYLVQTLAKLLKVPLAITDATSLTEAGYIGDDVESVLSKLLAAANNDVEQAERGIVFIDEIDKIAKKRNTNSRDVSGEAVQHGLLKLLEGADVEVPVGATSKNAMVPMTTISTRNILFICGGAFSELGKVIRERLNKSASIGFMADLRDKYDKERNILKYATAEDLREFGMIPEFLGRLPVICTLNDLGKDMLVEILTKPKNAITKQYKKLLAMDEVDLIFEQDALELIAERALEKKTGARALRAILEEFMLDIMYEIPKDENIGKVRITRAYIEQKGAPGIELRSNTLGLLQSSEGMLEEGKNNNLIVQNSDTNVVNG